MWTTNTKGAIFKIWEHGAVKNMNGYRSEHEDQSSNSGQTCCLVEDNERCKRPASNASYSKRIQKTVSQRKLKLSLDLSVSRGGISLLSVAPWKQCTNFELDNVTGKAYLHLWTSQEHDSERTEQEEAEKFRRRNGQPRGKTNVDSSQGLLVASLESNPWVFL